MDCIMCVCVRACVRGSDEAYVKMKIPYAESQSYYAFSSEHNNMVCVRALSKVSIEQCFAYVDDYSEITKL